MICLHDVSAHLKSARTSARHASTVPPHVKPSGTCGILVLFVIRDCQGNAILSVAVPEQKRVEHVGDLVACPFFVNGLDWSQDLSDVRSFDSRRMLLQLTECYDEAEGTMENWDPHSLSAKSDSADTLEQANEWSKCSRLLGGMRKLAGRRQFL